MCSCSSSLFLSLPVLNARLVRPNSQNCRRFHHEINTSYTSKPVSRCIGSSSSVFLGKFRFRETSIVSCLKSPLPNEEDVVGSSSSDVVMGKDSDLIRVESENDLINSVSKGFKQTTTRSNLVAKQVISIQSALSLGFISQLWVDTTSWFVLVVDVKPSLLSGESERFLLKDIVRVGDVVLVGDEAVLDTEFKMVGLETLVGYRVVTPGGRNIGKVRGYSFNINSGVVESLLLDSFGVTIIPSSLVSTYRLDVEDVIEVLEDVVVVHEAAASRKQRLTKGLWDAQFGEYSDVEELQSSSDRRWRKRSNRASRKRINLDDDRWDIFR